MKRICIVILLLIAVNAVSQEVQRPPGYENVEILNEPQDYWDYEGAQFEEIEKGTKIALWGTLNNINKKKNFYYAYICTLEWSKYSARYDGGYIEVIFVQRPRVRKGESRFLVFARYKGVVERTFQQLFTGTKRKIVLPVFEGDAIFDPNAGLAVLREE